LKPLEQRSMEAWLGPDTEPGVKPRRKWAKGKGKLSGFEGMPGAGLTEGLSRQALSDMLALKPYWGKPAVRDFREGDGNVGIIRSPVRAIVLPDHQLGGPKDRQRVGPAVRPGTGIG